MPAAEFQGDIIIIDPDDFTRIFALEFSIHADNARVTNLQSVKQLIIMHQCTAKRDVPHRGRVVRISQCQDTCLFRLKSFV